MKHIRILLALLLGLALVWSNAPLVGVSEARAGQATHPLDERGADEGTSSDAQAASGALLFNEAEASYSPMGRQCIEPTGEADPSHPSHIRTNFYNEYGCKIPLREGKSNFGYRHIVNRGEEQLAQGKPNSHEVTPFAQRLWAAALGRPGGSLLLNPDGGYFVASWPYTIRGKQERIMCVFYATNDLSYGGRSYKVTGVVTAYWIEGNSQNPSQSCRDARER